MSRINRILHPHLTTYFKYDIIFTLFAIIGGGFYGYYLWGTLWSAFSTIFIIVLLGLLEISLSFDNAIVNVRFLKKMNKKRQKKFLTWWILIAVFGIRFVFPIVLVAIFASITPWEAIRLAISDPHQYSIILDSSHTLIAGFGGTFLLLVGLNFFFEQGKKIHRFSHLESFLETLGKVHGIDVIIVLLILQILTQFVDPSQAQEFFISWVRWVVLYLMVNGIGSLFGQWFGNQAGKAVAKSWLMWFIYLEVLDASFSLDGVIGAFALSSNIFVIMIWLGIGAFFIRSMTFYMLDHKTLKVYRYLEHGAFYSVIALAIMMLLWTLMDLPDMAVGLAGFALISLSFYTSYLEKKYDLPWYQKLLRKKLA